MIHNSQSRNTRSAQIGVFLDCQNPSPAEDIYGEYEARIAIDTLEIIEGKLPRRPLGRVLDWPELHRQELRDNWGRGSGAQHALPNCAAGVKE